MGQSVNAVKLRGILDALSIPICKVAALSGVSRPMISRILAPEDDYNGSPQFWLALERALGKIIEERRVHVFQHESVSSEQLHACLKRAS